MPTTAAVVVDKSDVTQGLYEISIRCASCGQYHGMRGAVHAEEGVEYWIGDEIEIQVREEEDDWIYDLTGTGLVALLADTNGDPNGG